jgi:outer membrane lipoprotein SlyB
MHFIRIMVFAAVIATLLAGCAASKSGSVYSREDARREATVRMGVVKSVRSVTIEGTKSHIGTAGGAIVQEAEKCSSLVSAYGCSP